jgi:hypothetical protein
MNTIDIDQLAPAAATARPSIRQIAGNAVVSVEGDTETSVSLIAYHDKAAAAYRALLMRMTVRTDPATGLPSPVTSVGGTAAPRVVLFSVPGEWSMERLEALYAQAFEAVEARMAGGDERVAALLAAA